MTCAGFCVVAALSRYTSGMPLDSLRSRMGKSFLTRATSSMASLPQPADDGVPHFLAHVVQRDLREERLEEPFDHDAPRAQLVEAARAQVEDLLGVDLADGGAVARGD